MKNILQKITDYGLLATLIIFPLSINIALLSPHDAGHPLISINFSLADIFIGVLLTLWGFKVSIYNEWKQLKFPPLPIFVFVAIVLISFVKAASLSEWAKESVQITEYFILFYLLLLNNLKAIKTKTVFYFFFLSTSILLLVAFIQHSVLNADVYLVRGLFENRNLLGAYLCLAIPLVYTELINTPRSYMKIWMAILLIISLWVLSSASALISIIIGLGIISWKISNKVFLRYLIFILTLMIAYPFVFPLKNVNTVKGFFSIHEQGSISKNYYRRLTMIGDRGKMILFRKDLGGNYLRIATEQYLKISLPEPQKGDRYKDLENKKQIKNLYIEMQASLNLLSDNLLLGIGAGNYQNNIGVFFKELPKVNTTEPYQNNTYLIIASTTGVLGLSALFWFLFYLLRIGNKKYKCTYPKIYSICILGCLVSILIEGFFTQIFNASLMVPLVYIWYIAIKLITEPLEESKELYALKL